LRIWSFPKIAYCTVLIDFAILITRYSILNRFSTTMENDNTALCKYCPETLSEEFRTMPRTALRDHIAADHLDRGMNENSPPAVYVFDGNGIASQCTPDQVFETTAVNEYVAHMDRYHGDQQIPFHIRYKAALSELMAELCFVDAAQIPTFLPEVATSSNNGQVNNLTQMFEYLTTSSGDPIQQPAAAHFEEISIPLATPSPLLESDMESNVNGESHLDEWKEDMDPESPPQIQTPTPNSGAKFQ